MSTVSYRTLVYLRRVAAHSLSMLLLKKRGESSAGSVDTMKSCRCNASLMGLPGAQKTFWIGASDLLEIPSDAGSIGV